MLNIPFQLIQILAPMLLVNILNIKNPLKVFFRIYPLRMLMTAILAAWIYTGPMFIETTNSKFWIYIGVFATLNGVYSLLIAALDMLRVYFYAKISDKNIGGTYMTLLHTLSNMGYTLPMTLAFYLLEVFTKRNSCLTSNGDTGLLNSTMIPTEFGNNTCSSKVENEVKIKLKKRARI